jgi:hypothetical protein
VSPDSASRSDVLFARLTGTNFYRGVTSFGFGQGITVDSLSFTSSTSVLARVSISSTATLGYRTITVTNSPPGGGTVTRTNAFQVFNIPKLFSLNPVSGVRGQTLNVVLTGTNFAAGVSTVVISPTLPNAQQVISPTQIVVNVTIPTDATDGVRQFTVTNSGPYGGTSEAQAFTIGANPAPQLTGVSPDTGSRLNTIAVTIVGKNFYSGLTSVSMGNGIRISGVTVDSTTQMRFNAEIADTAVTGARDVIVTNAPPGGGTATLAKAFAVRNPAPDITNIAPQNANRLQTRDITITGGRFFKDATTVSFGPNITVDSLKVLSNTQMTMRIRVDSAAATGPRNVVVLNAPPGGGADTLQRGFTINNPGSVLATINPETVPVGSAQLQLSATGSNFVPESIVKLDTLRLATTYLSTTSLRATVPASELDTAKVFAITVETPGAGASNSLSFTVTNPAPTLLSVTPDSVYRLQAVPMVLRGTGFVKGATSVSLNPASDLLVRSVTIDSASRITLNLEVGAAAVIGQRVLTVSNPAPGGGTSAAKTFVIAGNPVPTLASVQPAILSRLQTSDVVLVGTNFITNVTSVNFGTDIAVNTLTVDSSRQIRANISVGGSAATGSRNVTVTNAPPAGGTSTPRTIQINNPVPVVRTITPSNGEQSQTLNVTLSGRFFLTGVSSLSMGTGITVSNLTVVNDSALTASITIGTSATTGPRDVVVTNAAPGGGSGVLTNGFVVGVNPPPTLTNIQPATGARLQTLNLVFRGTNFLGGVTSVEMGTGIVLNSVTVDSSTKLTANVSILSTAPVGSRTVVLVNRPPGGGRDSTLNNFAVLNPLPVLARVTPAIGILDQQLDLVFHGANFIQGVSSVAMGQGIAVNTVTVDHDTDLVANVTISSSAPLGPRSISVSNAGPGGGVSGSVEFTVDIPPSGVPALQSPSDGASNLFTTVTMSWSSVTGATGYMLEIATDAAFQSLAFADSNLVQTSRQVGPLTPQTTYHWRVRAKFSTGAGAYSSPRSFVTGVGYPGTILLTTTIAFPTKSNPSDYLPSEYRIVGLPGESNLTIPEVVGGAQNVDWQAWWDNGAPDASKGILQYDGSDTYKFTVGRAFWLIRKGNLVLSKTVPSAPLDTGNAAVVPLHSNWNLITSPFPNPVAWAAILAANGLPAGDPIYHYDGSPYSRPGTMSPFVGYYYFNTSGISAIRFPFSTAYSKVSDPVQDPAILWTVQVTMETGTYHDQLLAFGVAKGARRDLDLLDHRRPPAIGSVPSIYFARPAWDTDFPRFVTDVRPGVDGVEEWEFEVNSHSKEPVQLAFAGLDEVPHSYAVMLLDRDRAQSIDLRATPEFRFSPARQVSQFSVLVGNPEEVRKKLDDVVPRTFALGDNFPNPFNPSTTIPVAVPLAAEVTLKIYNLLGEEIKTLQAGPLEPGRYWFTWDGRNRGGAQVASGVYLSRLTSSSGVSFTKKMVLMK